VATNNTAAANRRRNSRILAGYAANPASVPKPWAFKPYTPPRPPSGSYDPALDAARDAARRGLGDVRQDTALAGTRAATDFQLGQDDVNRSFNRYDEDYRRNTDMLKRSYDILAGRQAESANVQGVMGGGALLEAAAKRQANQALEQGGLDTGRARAVEDRDLGIGQLNLGYERGTTDRATSLARAGREDTAFGLDTAAQRAYQAAGAGYVPPGRGQPGGPPKNEFTNKHGLQRRRIVRGGVEYIVAPDGSVVHTKRVGR
jgi:hypothetical protein